MALKHFKAKDVTQLPALEEIPRGGKWNRLWGVFPESAYQTLQQGHVTNCMEIPEALFPLVEIVDPVTTGQDAGKAPKPRAKKPGANK